MPDKIPNASGAFGFFRAQVSNVSRLSPTFLRVTFTGQALRHFGNPQRTLDQRIKLVFPGPDGLPDLRQGSTFTDWKSLPDGKRGYMRTYSIRDLLVHPDGTTELTVDFAVHGSNPRGKRVNHVDPLSADVRGTDSHNTGLRSEELSDTGDSASGSGPGTEWAQAAAAGDEALIYGPRRGRLDGGGIEFEPSDAKSIILIGDETAVPAATRILQETAGDGAQITAFLEVPSGADALPVKLGADQNLNWLVRGQGEVGSAVIPALLEHLGLDESECDEACRPLTSDGLAPWETAGYSNLEDLARPQSAHVQAAPGHDCYFWVAGESSMVTALRRHLVKDLGVPRDAVAFMGYWRRGVAMRA